MSTVLSYQHEHRGAEFKENNLVEFMCSVEFRYPRC